MKSKPLYEILIIPRSTGRQRRWYLTRFRLGLMIAIAAVLLGLILFLAFSKGADAMKLAELTSLRAENERLREELVLVEELERQLSAAEDIETRLRVMLGEEVARDQRAESQEFLTTAQPYTPGEAGELGETVPTGEVDYGFDPTSRAAELEAYVAQMAATNNLSTPRGWPLGGWLTRGFTPSGAEKHLGVDIAADIGRGVECTAPGVVVFAGEDSYYGLKVVVRHGSGYSTIYGHLSKLLVEVGETVERGHRLALSGNTGTSTNPHLHYEIRRDDVPLDPQPFMGER